jgi:hypothetical protein
MYYIENEARKRKQSIRVTDVGVLAVIAIRAIRCFDRADPERSSVRISTPGH